ncbi:hypothetical protein GCM10023189_44900 [Nibrella saemangeumensis]|uniref:PD-(D/E)XK endonuclease-like domain-containing protein n=1 Tax=Nibrella saemangeumensis TaxID=1084526 RepID=A0ABP8NFF3_9BACT
MDWSYSALTTFRRCNRQYYFGYVAPSHYFTDPYRRKLFELKNSKSLHMWQGSVIDYIVETEVVDGLRKRKKLNFNQIAQKGVELAQRQFAFSESLKYREKGLSKAGVGADYCILDIHESQKPYTEEEIQNVYTQIHDVLSKFSTLKSPIDGRLMSNFIEDHSLIIPNVRFIKFEFENIRVTPQIDLLLGKGNKAVIIDWKVSDSDVSDYSLQLIIAGIAVLYTNQQRFGKAYMRSTDIELWEVNLLTQELKKHPFTTDEINQTIDYIYLNADESTLMQKQESQKPFVDDFPITDKPSTCQFCKFRYMCSYLLENNYEYNEQQYSEFVQTTEFT